MMRPVLTIAMALAWPTATSAQDAAGRVANSSVGQAGQRETRDQSPTGAVPTGPIDSRIQNRVQSRIRNRIDRFYDPQANAVSPFRVADEQARIAGRTRR